MNLGSAVLDSSQVMLNSCMSQDWGWVGENEPRVWQRLDDSSRDKVKEYM